MARLEMFDCVALECIRFALSSLWAGLEDHENVSCALTFDTAQA